MLYKIICSILDGCSMRNLTSFLHQNLDVEDTYLLIIPVVRNCQTVHFSAPFYL